MPTQDVGLLIWGVSSDVKMGKISFFFLFSFLFLLYLSLVFKVGRNEVDSILCHKV